MIEFRNATEAELSEVIDWAANEGWNPGFDDAAAFFAADPAGFFIAVQAGEPVAAISVVNHSDSFSFLGLYIVRPSHRGQGIGYDLWQHAMRHAEQRTIGLDGVPDQQPNYSKSGFCKTGGTTRFSGSISPRAATNVRLARADDIATLIEREATASGTRKNAYLSAWFGNTPTRKTFIDPAGFCTARACRDGTKIGPLLADDTASAQRLIQHAVSAFENPVVIDVPDKSSALVQLCQDLGLAPGFETARMYCGDAPVGKADIYAVATLELG